MSLSSSSSGSLLVNLLKQNGPLVQAQNMAHRICWPMHRQFSDLQAVSDSQPHRRARGHGLVSEEHLLAQTQLTKTCLCHQLPSCIPADQEIVDLNPKQHTFVQLGSVLASCFSQKLLYILLLVARNTVWGHPWILFLQMMTEEDNTPKLVCIKKNPKNVSRHAQDRQSLRVTLNGVY